MWTVLYTAHWINDMPISYPDMSADIKLWKHDELVNILLVPVTRNMKNTTIVITLISLTLVMGWQVKSKRCTTAWKML